MAFKKKTWIDRMVEFAGRRKITNVSTSAAQIIDVERAEGAVSQEGDAFSAENMNDLEKRISDAFADVPSGYKIADNDTTNNSEFLATARVAYEHGLEIDALSRDIDTILQKLSRGFRIELSIGQYIWKPENESQWHGSGDSARITLEISADGIAIAKVTNPGDFRAYGTDHGRINKVGIVSIHPL